jgi:hypothetical protein
VSAYSDVVCVSFVDIVIAAQLVSAYSDVGTVITVVATVKKIWLNQTLSDIKECYKVN